MYPHSLYFKMNKQNKIDLKPILVVSATRSETAKDTRLASCSASLDNQATFKYETNNQRGLPDVYNKYFTKKVAKKHDIVVFCHDDLYIDDMKLRGKLYKSMFVDKYDIVGLAGATTCTINEQTPTLWHLMSDRKTWSGTVHHPAGADTNMVMSSTYGPVPQRCLVLDGVFLAVNINRARETGWRFNNNFKYHHYDVASCLDANEKQMKMGTCLVHAIHDSPGLSSVDDPEWKSSSEKFLELYNK